MSRRDRILTLLEHLDDYQPQLGTSTGNSGGIQQMPPMYHHPSVKELHRVLDQLGQVDIYAKANVKLYYLCEQRTRNTTTRVKTKKGYKNTPGPRTRERILPANFSMPAKDRGVKYILDNYQGEPFLPDELREELSSTG